MKLHGWLNTWWLKVPSPRLLSVLWAISYAVAILGGLLTYLFPPRTLLGHLDEFTTKGMGILLIVGGLIAAAAGTRVAWRLERIGISAMMLALGMYIATVVHNAMNTQGNYYTQIMGLVLAVMLFVIRLGFIRVYTYQPDPQKKE